MTQKVKIIFLDIDGVLNSVKQPALDASRIMGISPWHVNKLNRIIERTSAKIVISSSWRKFHSVDELFVLLVNAGFNGNRADLLGATKNLNTIRGVEIQGWLKDNLEIVESFVILDDDNDMLDIQGSRLVLTDFNNGLGNEHIDKAVIILNKAIDKGDGLW